MPPALAGWCICCRSQRMRLCKRDEQSSRPRSFGNSMLRVQGLKARTRKECVAWGCDGRTTMGLPKTHFQHVLTAVAINLVRIDAWLLAKLPGATYQPPLALLAAHPLLHQPPPPLQEAC